MAVESLAIASKLVLLSLTYAHDLTSRGVIALPLEPTRLADGLGLGSALREAGFAMRPSSVFPERWFPRVVLRPQNQGRLNNFGRQLVNEKNHKLLVGTLSIQNSRSILRDLRCAIVSFMRVEDQI